ncbi:pilus assembly protein TadG-related protein [Cupriavidus sp. PET2-C1]
MRPHGNRTRRQRGAVGLMTPFLLTFMLAFTALAIDVARLMIVRNELQNAADAAALAGAGGLYPPDPASPTSPNWANGITQGTQAITLNATEGVKLVSAQGQVQSGYWDLSRAKGLQSPGTPGTPGPNDAAAIQVTVSRTTGTSNSPVSMLLGSFFGIASEPARATAVAVIAAPGAVGPGTLLPLAIGLCQYQKYWDSTKGQPKIDPTTNQPYVFNINDSYSSATDGPCDNGQWTAFNATGQVGASTVTSLISTGNTSTLSINQNIIFLNNGVADSVYKAVQPLIGQIVAIPVVSQVVPGQSEPIVAFAAFKITAVSRTGTPKYISGSFVGNYKIPNSGGGVGPYYGAYVPPRLAG